MKLFVVFAILLGAHEAAAAQCPASNYEVRKVKDVIIKRQIQNFCYELTPPETRTKTIPVTETEHLTIGTGGLFTKTKTFYETSTEFSTCTKVINTKSKTTISWTKSKTKVGIPATVLDSVSATTVATETGPSTSVSYIVPPWPTTIIWEEPARKRSTMPQPLRKFCEDSVREACRAIVRPIKTTVTQTTTTTTTSLTRTKVKESATISKARTKISRTSTTNTILKTKTEKVKEITTKRPTATQFTTVEVATTTTIAPPGPTGMCDPASPLIRYSTGFSLRFGNLNIDYKAKFGNFAGDTATCCQSCQNTPGCAGWASIPFQWCNIAVPKGRSEPPWANSNPIEDPEILEV